MASFQFPRIQSALSLGRSVTAQAITSKSRNVKLRWRLTYNLTHRSFSSSQSGYSFTSTGGSISTGLNKSNSSHYSTSNACGQAADKKLYDTDTQTLARWLDVGIVKKKGRAFAADKSLLPTVDAVKFPSVKGTNLYGDSVVVPESFNNISDAVFKQTDGKTAPAAIAETGTVKLVCFSIKHYGFTLVRSWCDPFVAHFNLADSAERSRSSVPVVCIELCFVEYGFLSMAQGVFASNLKSKIPESQHNSTVLSFGGIDKFASYLELPNKYTGYAYLLDQHNRVRWRGCGQADAEEGEVQAMIQCAEQLILEGQQQQQQQQLGQGQGTKKTKGKTKGSST